MKNNIDKLTKLYNELGYSTLIIPSTLDNFYFTNFENDFCYLVVNEKGVHYLTDSRYTSAVKNVLDIEIIEVKFNNLYANLEKLIKDKNSVAIDENYLFYNDYRELKNELKIDDFHFIGQKVTNLKAIKTKNEIETLKVAVKIADEAFSKLIPQINEGVTEKELAAMLDYYMMLLGAEKSSFDTIVGFGENSAYPHHMKSDRKLKYGDNILIDFGALYKGYHSDITRVISFGKPDSDYIKIYQAVLDANKIAIDKIQENMKGSEADSFAREFLKTQNLDNKFIHSLGHGIGVEIHEFPRLGPASNDILLKNMTFTIEPGVYIDGKYGVRIEDSVLLDGQINKLTQSDKELLIL